MKTLITGALRLSDDERLQLISIGLEIILHPDERLPVDEPELVEVVICNALFLHQPIERFTKLKLIQLTSAGLDRVPIDYIRAHGIHLFSSRGVYSVPMAEFAIGGVLQLYKQSHFFWKNKQEHLWQKHRGLLELTDKRVCIVGTGSVGSEVAKRFAAFDAIVIGVNRNQKETEYFHDVVGMDELDELLMISDIIILTIPLSDTTRHLFDRSRLEKMKTGAILVNISRGAIVEQTALIDSLQSGNLSGAVLDAFEEEPLPEDSSLWDIDNLIITPHNSFVSEQIHQRIMDLVKGNINDYVAGKLK